MAFTIIHCDSARTGTVVMLSACTINRESDLINDAVLSNKNPWCVYNVADLFRSGVI